MYQREHRKATQMSGKGILSDFGHLRYVFYRISEEDRDRRVDRDDEFSDSEDEGEGGRRNKEDFKHASS